jgi:hypothetical protein
MPTLYNRDESLPYWRNNIDVDALLEDLAIRQDDALTMRGHFEGAILGDHTFQFTFTPGEGAPAIIFPVHDERGRLVDILAIAPDDYALYGCVTGQGQFVGELASQLRVHRTASSWIENDFEGILPLAKACYPLLQLATCITADDAGHAERLVNEVYIYTAERFGLDVAAAEQSARNKIRF